MCKQENILEVLLKICKFQFSGPLYEMFPSWIIRTKTKGVDMPGATGGEAAAMLPLEVEQIPASQSI